MAQSEEDGSDGYSRRRFLAATGAAGVGVAFGAGTASGGEPEADLRSRFREVAADTYGFFEEFTAAGTGFAYDRVDVSGDSPSPAERSSPANVGVQLLSTVSAAELGVVDRSRAKERVGTVLDTLESVPTWNGFFFRWYDTADGTVDRDFGGYFVSTVDNGWLSAALVVVGQAFPEFSDRTAALLEAQDYGRLYDPEVYHPFRGEVGSPGQMYGGYTPEEGPTGFHFGAFDTEPRVASYVGIGKGDVPPEHWWGMSRVFPPAWGFNQDATGEFRTYDGVEVFEGHYEYLGETYVPSWGGSMFESLMPSLVLPERELGRQALGPNGAAQARVQVKHAEERGYDAWGFSPCATPDGYGAFGVEQAGIWGYGEEGIVAPHATLLASEFLDDATVAANLDALRDLGAYGDYGFRDSVDVTDGTVTEAYLALDQGMCLVPVANYLTGGAVRRYFRSDAVGSRPADALAEERFTG
ncbi:MAG: glucoamylase family protein [Halobacteriaceae archaeon]